VVVVVPPAMLLRRFRLGLVSGLVPAWLQAVVAEQPERQHPVQWVLFQVAFLLPHPFLGAALVFPVRVAVGSMRPLLLVQVWALVLACPRVSVQVPGVFQQWVRTPVVTVRQRLAGLARLQLRPVRPELAVAQGLVPLQQQLAQERAQQA
jgi:hypothetical protein